MIDANTNTRGRKFMFTVKQAKRMQEMKDEGSSHVAIGRTYGVSKGTVSSYLRRLAELSADKHQS